MSKYNVMRVHRGIDGNTDKNWRVEPYSYANERPLSYYDALEYCKWYAERQRHEAGCTNVTRLSQAIDFAPDLADVADFAARGARVVIDRFLCTIDVYYPFRVE